jgi:dsDNA-specific endonuclease/ATPase MutS2
LHAQRERETFERRLAGLDAERRNFEQWTQWIGSLAPGDEVFVKPLQRTGKVVRMELHKQRALVMAGSMHVEVALRDLSVNADTA